MFSILKRILLVVFIVGLSAGNVSASVGDSLLCALRSFSISDAPARDSRVRSVKSFEISDTMLLRIVKNYLYMAKRCDGFDSGWGGKSYGDTKLFLTTTVDDKIVLNALSDSNEYAGYDGSYACIIDSVTVVIDKNDCNSEISHHVTFLPDKYVNVSGFSAIWLPIGIADPPASVSLTYNKNHELVFIEVWHDCEKCPPLDMSLFPECTMFHRWCGGPRLAIIRPAMPPAVPLIQMPPAETDRKRLKIINVNKI